MEKQFLSRKEMSTALGISLSSINRGIKKNTPPFNEFIRIGRRILFPISSITSLQKVCMKSEAYNGV